MSYTPFSPLQDLLICFRNAQNKIFGGIDTTMPYPFERKNGSKVFLSAGFITQRTITLEVIPQIITNDADEFYLSPNMFRSLGIKN
jgi:hypothetical protein